jgi:hypothetical protein
MKLRWRSFRWPKTAGGSISDSDLRVCWGAQQKIEASSRASLAEILFSTHLGFIEVPFRLEDEAEELSKSITCVGKSADYQTLTYFADLS